MLLTVAHVPITWIVNINMELYTVL